MSKLNLMSDKRLAEIEYTVSKGTKYWVDLLPELLQALKAEREYAERTCEWWREWDEDGSHWETSCGADDLQRGTYCSCCGGLIVETNDD